MKPVACRSIIAGNIRFSVASPTPLKWFGMLMNFFISRKYLALISSRGGLNWSLCCLKKMRKWWRKSNKIGEQPIPAVFKGICYGSDPVGISLQLTDFQSLIGLRMNHIVFSEDPKSHLSVSRTCTFFKYTITANGKMTFQEKKYISSKD